MLNKLESTLGPKLQCEHVLVAMFLPAVRLSPKWRPQRRPVSAVPRTGIYRPITGGASSSTGTTCTRWRAFPGIPINATWAND